MTLLVVVIGGPADPAGYQQLDKQLAAFDPDGREAGDAPVPRRWGMGSIGVRLFDGIDRLAKAANSLTALLILIAVVLLNLLHPDGFEGLLQRLK